MTDGVRPPFLTVAVTGVPSANSGHCSAIPGAVAILWELRRGTERARHYSPYYSANSGRPDSTSSHVRPRAHLLLGRRSGVATSPSERDAHHSQPGARTSPLEGSGTSTCLPDLLSVHVSTPSRGSGTAACPAAAGVHKILTHRARGTPHLESCTPYSDDHSAYRGWQDAGAISARPRTMARTIATPNAMPHSVLSTVFDHCTPTTRGKTAASMFPYSCTPSLLVSIKRGGEHPLKRSVDSLDTNRSEHTHLLLSPTSTFATLKPHF